MLGMLTYLEVSNIERFEAELEPAVFRQPDLPMQSKVDLPGRKAAKHIAAEIPVRTGWRRRKCIWIVRLSARIFVRA